MQVIFNGRKVAITELDCNGMHGDPVDAFAQTAYYLDNVFMDYGAGRELTDVEMDELNQECAAEIQDEWRLRQAGG